MTADVASVAVLIPFGGECAHRARALDYVLDQYAERHPAWDTIVGRYDETPWIKARAIAAALEHTDAELLVLNDADMYCPEIAVAVQRVAGGAPWACPYLWVDRLDEFATTQLIETSVAGDSRDEAPTHGQLGGGIVVVPRATYEQCPIDPRFRGWGHEDSAWVLALDSLVGNPWVGTARAWHLWHPHAERLTRSKGNDANEQLYMRYQEWCSFPPLMRKLRAEVLECG